jgi:hypothetical protein
MMEIKAEISCCSLESADDRDNLVQMLNHYTKQLKTLTFDPDPEAGYGHYCNIAYDTKRDMAMGGV